MSESLQIERQGRVLRLRLNRPDKRNALTFGLCREIVDALAAAEDDADAGAVLISGNGPVFCAGMDLDEAVGSEAAAQSAIHEELFTFGARMRKPVVAAVHGAALGGGMGLAANPHVAIAAQGSKFGLTEIRVGLWPFLVYRSVVAAIGERRTLELSLTGRIFGTQEALEWGLVQHVVPAHELDERASEIAAGLAASSPEIIRIGLEFVSAARGLPWREAGEIAARSRNEAFASADFHEGVRAFKEKRKPDWPSLGKR